MYTITEGVTVKVSRLKLTRNVTEMKHEIFGLPFNAYVLDNPSKRGVTLYVNYRAVSHHPNVREAYEAAMTYPIFAPGEKES